MKLLRRIYDWIFPVICEGHRSHHWHRSFELSPPSNVAPYCHKGRYVDKCCRCDAIGEIEKDQ